MFLTFKQGNTRVIEMENARIRNLQGGLDGQDAINLAQLLSGIPGNSGASGNRIISGGLVSFVQNLTVEVTACQYIINGTIYNTPYTQLTLQAADPVNPRIDVIYVSTAVGASPQVLTGIPAATPVKPAIDVTTQLELSFVSIPANSTTITVNQVAIYLENTEWTTTNSANVNPNDTSAPFAGAKDVAYTLAQNGNFCQFAHAQDLSVYTILTLKVRLNSFLVNLQIQFQWRTAGGAIIGNVVSIQNGTFGFNGNLVGSYQTLTIPLSAFNLSQLQIASLRIVCIGNGGNWLLDNIYLEDLPVSGTQSATVPTLSQVLHSGNDAGALKIVNLVDPTSAQDAATKHYVDNAAGGASGLNLLASFTTPDTTSITITFNNIPQTSTHLKIIASVLQKAGEVSDPTFCMRVNNDSTLGHYGTAGYAANAGTQAWASQTQASTGDTKAQIDYAQGNDGVNFESVEILIPNYTNAFAHFAQSRASWVQNNGLGSFIPRIAIMDSLLPTGAVTRLDFFLAGGGHFAAGVTISVYGMK